jgi:hypothetical protein
LRIDPALVPSPSSFGTSTWDEPPGRHFLSSSVA